MFKAFVDFIGRVSDDAIFATVTALLVLSIGGLFKWLYDHIKQAFSRRDLRNYFLEYLKSLLLPLQNRINVFKELSDNARAEVKDFTFKDVFVRSDHISQLEHTELFASLVGSFHLNKNKRIGAFNELLETLEFLTRQMTIAKAQFDYFFSNYRFYFDSWRNSVNQIIKYRRELLAYAHINNLKEPDDPFLAEINQIHNSWGELSNKDDYKIVNEHLIDPVKTVCFKYQKEPRRVMFLSDVADAEIARVNLSKILELMSTYFSDQAQMSLNKKNIIEQSINILF